VQSHHRSTHPVCIDPSANNHVNQCQYLTHQERIGGSGCDDRDTYTLHELRDGITGIRRLLPSIVTNGRDDARGATHTALLGGRRVVERNLGRRYLGLRDDDALRHQALVGVGDRLRQAVERAWHHGAGVSQCSVLGGGRLTVLATALGAGVTELHLGREHGSARTRDPRHDRLGDLTRLESIN